MKRFRKIPTIAALITWTTAGGMALGAEDPPPNAAREPRVPEALEMFWSILVRGADMGIGKAWFKPGQSRYGWDWLEARYDKDHDGLITADEFEGGKPLFARLDRDRDGVIAPEDFDWSDGSAYLRTRMPFRSKFQQADANSNGRVTREEFLALFNRAAGEKGFLTLDDVADLMGPPPRPRASAGGGPPPDMPSRWTLLKGFFSGEIGSMHEGPSLGEIGPDFSLRTHDGQFQITLSDFRGHKPVVLVFGSFT